MYSESGDEKNDYFYDSQNRFDSVKFYLDELDYVIDGATKLTYDANGNQVAEDGYQALNGDTKMTRTIHIDYTYEGGNLVERRNYNYNQSTGELDLGGVYKYEYENGRLVKDLLYFAYDMETPFSTTTYQYDDKGKLKRQETWMDSWFGTGQEFTDGIDYEYDEYDRLIYRHTLTVGDDGNPVRKGGTRYTYNSEGNVVEELAYSDTPDNPTSKNEYEYNIDVTVEEAALPVSIEDEDVISELSQNLKVKRLFWAMDMNSGELFFYDTYHFEYADVPTGTSIRDNVARPSRGNLMLQGNSLVAVGQTGQNAVKVFSLDGRLIMTAKPGGSKAIDISNLPSGTYVAEVGGSTLKFQKR